MTETPHFKWIIDKAALQSWHIYWDQASDLAVSFLVAKVKREKLLSDIDLAVENAKNNCFQMQLNYIF